MSNSEENPKKLLQLERFLKGEMNGAEKERFFELLLEEPRLFRLLKTNALILNTAKKTSPARNDEQPSDDSIDASCSNNVEEPVPYNGESSDVINGFSESVAAGNTGGKHVTFEDDPSTTRAHTPGHGSEEPSGTRSVLYFIRRRYTATLGVLTAVATLLLVLQFSLHRDMETEFPWSTDQIDLVNLVVPDVMRSSEQSMSDNHTTFSEAAILAFSGETRQAMRLYEQLAQSTFYPRNANFNLGILHFNSGDFDTSALHFTLASCSELETAAVVEACYWFKALSHLHAGEIDKALEEAKNTVNMQGVHKKQAAALSVWLEPQ